MAEPKTKKAARGEAMAKLTQRAADLMAAERQIHDQAAELCIMPLAVAYSARLQSHDGPARRSQARKIRSVR